MGEGAQTRVTIERIMAKAKRVLLRRGVPADDVDDLVHDAFVRITQYEKGHEVRTPEALFVTAAVNLSIDRQRSNGRSPFSHRAVDLEAIIDTQPTPEDIAAARARLTHLRAGLDRLNEKTRRIVIARRLDGLSVAEIAAREGLSIAAVEKQIARATLKLMHWMDGW